MNIELFIIFLFPFFVIHLFGFFDGAQTAKKDYPKEDDDGYENRIWKYMQLLGPAYEDWYLGGNEKYPPGNPFRCDFWHFMKWCWTLCISLFGLSVMLAVITIPFPYKLACLLYGFAYGVEGYSFSFYYAYVFRKGKSFRMFLQERDLWFIPGVLKKYFS